MNCLFCFLLLLPNNDTCKSKYLDELLRMPVEKEYLMVVKARHNSKKVDVALTNLELIQNLKSKRSEVNKNIIGKIKNNQVALIIDDSTKMMGTIKYYKTVTAIQAKGEKYFVDYFFDNAGYLKSTIKAEYTGQIIKVLFDWNVFVSEDDLGVLRLSRKEICN